ncbi:MAG TPA: hypothetical protein VGC99_28705, partial [Candidatus Tectomicrobia bacterium]
GDIGTGKAIWVTEFGTKPETLGPEHDAATLDHVFTVTDTTSQWEKSFYFTLDRQDPPSATPETNPLLWYDSIRHRQQITLTLSG